MHEADNVLKRIHGTTNLEEAVNNADIVIESISPNMELKKKVFRDLDEICLPRTILASNTSNMSITEIASLTKRQDKVIGTHFFNPVQVMRLIEIIKGANTSEETVDFVKEIAEKLGKEYVVINDFPGFVVSRIFNVLINEAIKIYSQGIASVEDIDKAVRLGLNHPMGPLQLADFNLSITLAGLEYLHKELGDEYRPCPEIKKRANAGLLGRKTGMGFYKYE
jgi:3-hydroxybutyryl-CoA dehydrogenase